MQWSRHAILTAVRLETAAGLQKPKYTLSSGWRQDPCQCLGVMCDCENMTSSLRDEKISEFFRTVFLRNANSEGAVSFDSLEATLVSLGRRVPPQQLAKIRKKFDKEGAGVINLKDPEFILTVASLNVKDIDAIKDDVLTSAFKIFDMVRNLKNQSISLNYVQVNYQFLMKVYF